MATDSDPKRRKASRSTSLKQQIVDALILDLRRGVIAPGSMISAKRIAEEHGVSRTPAREAVDTLVTLQLVKWVTNTGARVCEIDLPQLIDLLAARRGVEFRSGQKLGQKNAPGKLKELQEIWDKMQAEVAKKKAAEERGEAWHHDDKLKFFDMDIAFHQKLANLGGSEDMEYLITYLMNRIRLLAEKRLSFPEKTQEEHGAIIAAIEAYGKSPREKADEALAKSIEAHLLWSLHRWGGMEWVEAMAAATGWGVPPEMREGMRNRDDKPKPTGAARRSTPRAK